MFEVDVVGRAKSGYDRPNSFGKFYHPPLISNYLQKTFINLDDKRHSCLLKEDVVEVREFMLSMAHKKVL